MSRSYLAVITAKYDGQCPHCGEPVAAGEQVGQSGVTKDAYGQRWLHQACAALVHEAS